MRRLMLHALVGATILEITIGWLQWSGVVSPDPVFDALVILTVLCYAALLVWHRRRLRR